MSVLLVVFSIIATIISYLVSLFLEKDNKTDFLPNKTSRGLICVSTTLFILAAVFSNLTKLQFCGLLMLFVITLPLQITDFQSFTLPKTSSLSFVLLIGVVNSLLAEKNMYLLTIIVVIVGTILLLFLPFGIADIYVALALSVNLFNSINCAVGMLLGLGISTIAFLTFRFIDLRRGRNRFLSIIPYVPILINAIPIALLISGAGCWIIK